MKYMFQIYQKSSPHCKLQHDSKNWIFVHLKNLKLNYWALPNSKLIFCLIVECRERISIISDSVLCQNGTFFEPQTFFSVLCQTQFSYKGSVFQMKVTQNTHLHQYGRVLKAEFSISVEEGGVPRVLLALRSPTNHYFSLAAILTARHTHPPPPYTSHVLSIFRSSSVPNTHSAFSPLFSLFPAPIFPSKSRAFFSFRAPLSS